jgi:hypothetical protein
MAHLDTDLLKPTDVAGRLGVSRSWAYDAAATARTPCVRLSGPDGPFRFLPEDVEAWPEEARRTLLPGKQQSAALSATRSSANPTTQLRLLGEPYAGVLVHGTSVRKRWTAP